MSGIPPAAIAATLSASAFCSISAYDSTQQTSSTNPCSLNHAFVWNDRLSGVYVTASASATYGSVSAFAKAGAMNGSASSVAQSSFSDTITLLGGTGTGMIDISAPETQFGLNGFIVWDIPDVFTYGVPLTFGITAVADGDAAAADRTDDEETVADATVDSISLFDFSGLPVSGITYLTSSGTRYNVIGGTYVPEPSAFVPCVLLLCALLLIRTSIRERARLTLRPRAGRMQLPV